MILRDLQLHDPLALCVTAASAAGAVWSGVSEAALTVFGLPLPVVLAAFTGAFGARALRPSLGLPRTLLVGLAWSAVGLFSVPLTLQLLGWPERVAGGAALLIAGGLQLLMPTLLERGPLWVAAWIERFIGAGGKP